MTRILVIDDDRLVREAIKTVLQYEGFDVEIAETGALALETVKKSDFDLLIVDIFMPGMDGIETIRRLHTIAPSLPIIAISGYMFRASSAGAPDFLSMATKFGAVRGLRKPFKPRELVEAIRSCLAGEHDAPGAHPLQPLGQPTSAAADRSGDSGSIIPHTQAMIDRG